VAYGIIKVDTIIFDQGGADQNATVSGIYRAITSGVTVSGTIAGAVLIGTTTVSGTTVTGTTANFASGVFTTQVSGATVTGTQSSFTSGNFVTLSGATATFTSGVIASGTAAAPSLSIISDPNTGIYSPGAGQVAISTSGVGRLFVDASGNVGVGGSTTNIAGAKRVDIGVAGVSNGLLTLRSSGGAQEANISCSATGLGFTTNSYATPFDARASEIIFGTGSSGTERLRITSAGLVGIGTSSPGEKLTVAGNISLSAAQPYISLIDSIWGAGTTFRTGVNTLGTATGDYQLFNVPTGKGFAFAQNNATNSLVIDTSGRVGIGTSAPAFALDISASTDCVVRARVNSFTSAGFIGSTNNGTNNWFFGSRKDTIGGNSGTDRFNLLYDTNAFLTVTTAGNVGIGTTSPGQALEVSGSGVFTGGVVGQGAIIGRDGGTGGATYGCQSGDVLITAGNTNIRFTTSAIERARIDSSGRVGIGTTLPSRALEINASNGINTTIVPALRLKTGSTNGAAGYGTGIEFTIQDSSNVEFVSAKIESVYTDITNQFGDLRFSTNNATVLSERARIDSSGRLLVGTSTARSNFFDGASSAALQLEGNSTGTASLSITRNDATADGNALILAKARSTAYAVLQYVDGTTSDDRIGRISFQGADGTNMVPAANIEAFVDGTPGTNDMPGRLVFSTTADGASSPTERMRIDSAGNISIGSAASTTYRCAIAVASGADRDIFLSGVSGASNGFQVNWLHATTALSVKFNSITTTASAANAFLDSADGNRIYRSTSSLRYKKNVENIDQLKADAILSLRPVWYRSKASNDRQDWSWYGLIAEEVAQVEPRLVHWTYLDEDYETETVNGEIKKTLKEGAQQVPDGVQYDRLTVLLLDVVKRQQQAIETLEAKVAALESQ